MYAALAARDEGFVGVFYVGVRTTGIFCRPGCPARTPLRTNCEFFASATGAMQAGYRPCRRCRPMHAGVRHPDWAQSLLDRLEHSPERPITKSEVRALGVDPATASRYFKARLGATLPALVRARLLGCALRWIREGQRVSTVAMRSGFRSESGFRKAVAEVFGATPMRAARDGAEPIVATWLDTPLGPMLAAASERGVCMLEFVDRRALAEQVRSLRVRLGRPIVPGSHPHLRKLQRELDAYFTDPRAGFSVPLHMPGSPFQEDVWRVLGSIEAGATITYAQVAGAIGRVSAVRAVARAIGENRLAILVPCHRVIGSAGDLTGYAGGVWRKRRLLDHEGAAMTPAPASKNRSRRRPSVHARPDLFSA